MTIGFIGEMGHGKTALMTAFVTLMSDMFQKPIYANYLIKHDSFSWLNSKEKLREIKEGFVAFTEMSEDADSRSFKDNDFITSWINQSRKRRIVMFYDTQSMDQVDKRLRNRTDYVMLCEKNRDGSVLMSLINYRKVELVRKFRIKSLSPWFSLYDTEEIVGSLK